MTSDTKIRQTIFWAREIYRKDTEPLYHSFINSLVSILSNTYRKTTIYHIILTDGHPHQLWLRLCGWFCDIKHVIAIRIVFYGWKRTTWSQHLKTQCWLLGLGAWPTWHEWLIKPANPTPNFAQCSLLNLLLHYISPLS